MANKEKDKHTNNSTQDTTKTKQHEPTRKCDYLKKKKSPDIYICTFYLFE